MIKIGIDRMNDSIHILPSLLVEVYRNNKHLFFVVDLLFIKWSIYLEIKIK